jgi:hypothetical protein
MNFNDYSKEELRRMAKEYPSPSRMNYDPTGGSSTTPIRTRYKPYQYIYGAPEENIEKTARLKAYADSDPAMGERIAALTNEYVARAANSPAWQPEKDLYALGQDAYLMEMGRMGIRAAHKKARR